MVNSAFPDAAVRVRPLLLSLASGSGNENKVSDATGCDDRASGLGVSRGVRS